MLAAKNENKDVEKGVEEGKTRNDVKYLKRRKKKGRNEKQERRKAANRPHGNAT